MSCREQLTVYRQTDRQTESIKEEGMSFLSIPASFASILFGTSEKGKVIKKQLLIG